MLMIRECPGCGSRVRTAAWATGRPKRCCYCKADLPSEAESLERIAPTASEWAIWILGFLTQVMAVLVPMAILVWHKSLSMSWTGAGVVSALSLFLLMSIGHVARKGSPEETIGLDIFALVLLYGLTLYGFVAFPPLDALGGSAFLLLAVFCIVAVRVMDIDPITRHKIDRGRNSGWLILLGFLAAYSYHAFQKWSGR